MTDVVTVDDSGNVTASGDITGANLSGTNTGDQSDATLNFSDITTNNSSTSQHGFLKKLDNNSAHYMDGTGNWSTPPAPGLATTSVAGIVKPDGATIDVSSGVISVPTATTSLLGLVKTDGSTLTNSSGAIAVATATTSQLGAVKPDGSTITISSGVISATAYAVLSGTVIMWAADSAPSGYLECNGASVSTTTYAALFTAIGYTFGGSGSNFNIPDMRGYFPRGWADTGSIDSGRTFGSTQAAAFASHTHTATVTDPGHDHTYTKPGSFVTQLNGTQSCGTASGTTGTATTGITVANSSTGGSETRPINLALMFCIKT